MDQRTAPIHYEFGGFRLDTNLQTLVTPSGQPIHLTSKVFQTLLHLVEHSGEIVDKRLLMHAVWPNVIVEENNLNQCIVAIRKALGESASDRRFLLTVPGRGFKFVAPVRVAREDHETEAGSAEGSDVPESPEFHSRAGLKWKLLAAASFCGVAALGAWLYSSTRSPVTRPSEYEQLTDVAEAASAPALSRDGRLLAYILGDEQFMGAGQVYVKLLPAGEPVQLTHVKGSIYGSAFNPDGDRVAFTHVGQGTDPIDWETLTVSVLGGTPTQLLPNSSGLSWITPTRLMYSEVASGIHMGIVTSTASRAEHRTIYLPTHERGMAHFSFISPDGRSLIVAEMNPSGDFERCRLVPFDGSSSGMMVGPLGTCLSAAWSPDGRWMYFAAQTGKSSHLWRQRFPNGDPEQITFGPTKETAVVAAPDGRSLLTSLGSTQSTIWMHDAHGERRLTAETHAWHPWLSADGRRLYRLRRATSQSTTELVKLDLTSNQEQVLLPGFDVDVYDISADERNVLFTTSTPDKEPEIWTAPIDRHSSPLLIIRGGDQPVFGGPHNFFYRRVGLHANALYRADMDGHDERVLPMPIFDIVSDSPDGRFIVVGIETDGRAETAIFRTNDAALVWRRRGYWHSRWSPDNKMFYLETGWSAPGAPTIGTPMAGDSLPTNPSMLTSEATQIPHSVDSFYPTADPGTYLFVNFEQRRNIFRIPLH